MPIKSTVAIMSLLTLRNTNKILLMLLTGMTCMGAFLFSSDEVSLENKEGKKISAQIIRLEKGNLTIKPTGDFKYYTIALDSLNQESQERVKSHLNSQKPNTRVIKSIDIQQILTPKNAQELSKKFREMKNPDDDIYGLKFGDTYEKCVSELGKPNGILYTSEDFFTAYYHDLIAFIFEDRKLKQVSIEEGIVSNHIRRTFREDTPFNLSIMGDIELGMKLKDLEDKYDIVGENYRKYLRLKDTVIKFRLSTYNGEKIVHSITIK